VLKFSVSADIPQIVNDGVSIARAISLSDPLENAGAQLVKEVTGKTNDNAGDGTSSSAVFAREILRAGLKFLNARSPFSVVLRSS